MNQDIQDALARLKHAIENSSPAQAQPSFDAELARQIKATESAQALADQLEAVVDKERTRADAAEREAEYWRNEHRAIRDAAARTMDDALKIIAPMMVVENELNTYIATIGRLTLALDERTAELEAERAHARRADEERAALTHHAIALVNSIHGDGNGRCWCGAKEADQLRSFLEHQP